jgi:hexosaminidase
VWTEHIATEAQLKHQIMPRLAAMAEALWTNSEVKDYESFKLRMLGSSVFPQH